MQPFKELLTIFYYPKIYVDNNPWKMFNFLSIRLWLLIFCSYIAFALINRANRKSFGLFHLFANLMGQQTVQTSLVWRKFEWNPIIIWSFATFIIRELYSSDITAAILSANQFHFDTFEKLHHAGSDLQILIENQSSTFHYMNLVCLFACSIHFQHKKQIYLFISFTNFILTHTQKAFSIVGINANIGQV